MNQHKKFLRASYEKFIFEDFDYALDNFMWKYIDETSHQDFINVVNEHVGEFKIILSDYMTSMRKKVDAVVNSFMYGYRLLLVSGARNSGKTAFGFWLLEQCHKQNPKRRIAYIGVKVKKKYLPEWCENFTWQEYESMMYGNKLNGYIVLIDEAAIFLNARNWQKDANKKFGMTIAISRHKHISLMVLAQDHNMTDTNVWRLRDMVVYKKSNTYDIVDRDSHGSNPISQFWRYIKQWLHPKNQREFLFEYQSEKRLMLVENPLPTFWSKQLSEAFDYYNVDDEPEQAQKPQKVMIKEEAISISGVT